MSELMWIWVVLGALIAGVLAALIRKSRRELALRRTLAPDAPLPEPPALAPLRVDDALPLPRRRHPTRHPIVLAHGWGGIDRIGPFRVGYSYFRGIPASLRGAGHTVYIARVPPTASIDLRASALARQVRALDTRVNIIAHSMGGLDARLALARYGLSDRVASLTTIGTPHHGTPLADMALALGEWRRSRGLLDRMGLNVDGVYDVSTKRMREFNRRVADAPDVLYANVVAAVDLDAGGVHRMLAMGHSYLLRKAGPNDGIVPALSQLWGETLDEVDADHWAQIGWFGRFDVHAFYARLADRLAEREL
ncbi:MAG: alpha/beta fold hydrolase [Polyangiales bacterium]